MDVVCGERVSKSCSNWRVSEAKLAAQKRLGLFDIGFDALIEVIMQMMCYVLASRNIKKAICSEV